MATEIQLLERGFKSFDHMQKNFDKLAKKFEGKLIAITEGKIIASSDTIEDLIKQIEEKGMNPMEVYITSFPPKDFIWIL